MSDTVQLQDAILKAIDTMTSARIDRIAADKTITCQVLKCANSLDREYNVAYNGGKLVAYAQEGQSYATGQVVYVLVPQGDFSKRKTIVGVGQAKEDGNISFVSSALNDYNLIGRNSIMDNDNVQPASLHSYLRQEYKMLYSRTPLIVNGKPQELDKSLQIDVDELTNNLKEAEAIMLEASFYTRLPKEHRVTKSGRYGLEFILAFKNADTEEVKHYSYVIDTNNMSGNPFRFGSWSPQYQIYPIDTKNFLYIESILFFEEGFVEKDNQLQADDKLGWGADIFIKNIKLYGLKRIAAQNGKYRLSLSMPQGSTLKSITNQKSLEVVAKLTENNITDLSDGTMFYWFKEDNRVTSESSNYRMYGGAGWAYLENKGSNKLFETFGNENRAYENRYKVVAEYQHQLILKETFTIYNEAAKRELSISSTLGTKFSFDRGAPTLTCLVDGKSSNFEEGAANPHDDSLYSFVWSKEDPTGTVIFNETKEEAQKRYDNLIKSGDFSYSELAALRNLINSLEGVSWDRNSLTYPIKSIDAHATFKCSVYLKDTKDGESYCIGSATISLQNESVAEPTDYFIVIEGGDQVFQYTESGVSPDDERNVDPLKVKNLTCHFFDPAGLEVNNTTYEVKWRVPLEDSMVVVPKEGMTINHANDKIEFNVSQIYPLQIKKNYDYFALHNQIECIVTYGGQEYRQYTNLTFTKVGENGTNGTDIVAKISPVAAINKYLPLIEVDKDISSLSSGLALKFELYQRNEKLPTDDSKVSWSIAGGTSQNSKYLSANSGIVSYDNNEAISRKYRNQIVKASIKWEKNDYYAFYPVPIVYYPYGDVGFKVKILASETLKSILYNADGRNPLYNKNQSISIDIGDISKYIVWQVEGGPVSQVDGGYEEHPQTNPDIRLIREKNSSDGRVVLEQEGKENFSKVYILPNDVYSGEYSNNVVRCSIYQNEQIYRSNGNPQVEVYMPIHLSLNTVGLKSINAWDGNHIEINEDENFILAPQIGAGEKDKNNRFTGLVMGKSTFYDVSRSKDGHINDTTKTGNLEPVSSVGLLGYSQGKQSIFLDSKTGNATFGLPEDNNLQEKTGSKYDDIAKYSEGRIELRPGGISSIGNWKIGSRFLYNLVKDPRTTDNLERDTHLIEPYPDLRQAAENDGTKDRYKVSLPNDGEGIMLSAAPSFISIKGRMMEDKEQDAHYHEANTIIQPYDSFELQLNPNDPSIFTVYRHSNSPQDAAFVIIDDKIYNEADTDDSGNIKPDKVDKYYAQGYRIGSSAQSLVRYWVVNKDCPWEKNRYVIARPLKQYRDDGSVFYNFDPLQFYCSLVTVDNPEDREECTFYVPELAANAEDKLKYERKIFMRSHWHREAKVGINRQGRFYTNALKDNSTAMNIGNLGAYGRKANTMGYAGATFQVGQGDEAKSLVKFFTTLQDINNEKADLYITGGTNVADEYQRKLITGFKDYAFYARDYKSSATSTTQLDKITLSHDMIEIAHGEDTYLRLPSHKKDAVAALYTNNNLGITTTENFVLSSGSTTTNTNKDFTEQIGGKVISNIKGPYSRTLGTPNYALDLPETNLSITKNDVSLNMKDKERSNKAGFNFRYNSGMESSIWGEGLGLYTANKPIKLESNENSNGIMLDAKFDTDAVSLHLSPQVGGSASMWSLTSTNGSIQSNAKINNTLRCVSASPAVLSHAFYSDGIIDCAGRPKGAPSDYAWKYMGIYSSKDIYSSSWVYGSDFRFLANPRFNFHGYTSHDQVSLIFEEIFSELRWLRTSFTNHHHYLDLSGSSYGSVGGIINGVSLHKQTEYTKFVTNLIKANEGAVIGKAGPIDVTASRQIATGEVNGYRNFVTDASVSVSHGSASYSGGARISGNTGRPVF